MAISRGINLQSSGLTGRVRMLPPSLPPKYDLSMRRPVQPTGMAPVSSTGTIKPDFGAGLGPSGGAALAPGMTGDLPDNVPDSGLNWSDVKGVVAPAAVGFGAGLVTGGPPGAIVGGVSGARAGLMGKGINKFIVDPIKNALGFGPKTEEQPTVAGWDSPHFGSGISPNDNGPTYNGPPGISEQRGDLSPHFGSELTGEDPEANKDKGWFDSPGGGKDDNTTDSSSPGPSGGGFG